jgi:penicillin G amidase
VPGYRHIVDLGSTDGGRFIHAGGQSGHLLSPHYDSYLDDWQAVRYRPMRFTAEAIEAARAATLRLEPRSD